jgi:hypothetical protein
MLTKWFVRVRSIYPRPSQTSPRIGLSLEEVLPYGPTSRPAFAHSSLLTLAGKCRQLLKWTAVAENAFRSDDGETQA